MNQKLVRESVWKNIRDRYTTEEKKQLRSGLTGHCICPNGTFINLDLLPSDLRQKLENDLSRNVQS